MEGPELITIGRVSVDFYPEQPGPMWGVTSLQKSIGGTAANVAVAAARLGHDVAFVTKVGDDAFGLDVRHALEHRFGVDTSYVSVHPTLPTPLAFAELDPVEDPNIIFYRYPDAPDVHLDADDLAAVPVDRARIFWVPASRFAWPTSRAAVGAALDRRARRPHTVLDLDWRPHFWPNESAAHAAIDDVLDRFSIVIGNRDECRIAVGSDDPHVAADRVLERGVDLVVVKLGADGVYVADAVGRTLVPPHPVDVVCGLGAGDAFGGAFCHGLLTDASAVEAVRLGNVAGAIVASRLRCADDMPSLDELVAVAGGARERPAGSGAMTSEETP